MQLQKLMALAAISILFATGQTYADDADSAPSQPHKKMSADTNKDGKISYDEYRASKEKQTERQFKRMDTNGDGYIDESEKKASKAKMQEMREKRKQKQKSQQNSKDQPSEAEKPD